MVTAQQIVERSLAAYGRRVAVDDGRLITYGELADRSARLANAFLAKGASGDRPVAIFLPNTFHFIEVDAACMRAGITRVGISARLTADECQFILGHSGAALLVTSAAMLDMLDRPLLDSLDAIMLIDRESHCGNILSYEATIRGAAEKLHSRQVAADDPAYILYTSGTTGRPKGAMHTHGGRAAALTNMMANELVIDHDSGMIHTGSLTHGSGSKVLSFLSRGARNIILPRFDPEALAHAIEHRGGTHTFLVPTMLQMLAEAGPSVCSIVSRMNQISFGGAPISNAAFGRAVHAFGPRLVQVYGTSEAPHPLSVLRPDDYAGASEVGLYGETAGRVATGVQLGLMDDAGKLLPVGCEGELVVRGPMVMRGYWRDEQATADVIDAAGWYHTGDVAAIDDTGLIRLRDRKRDLIISGGLNVYPSEVERVLGENAAIREVAVVGAPDDHWGETVVAFVAFRPGSVQDPMALSSWIEGRLAGYKKPRRFVVLDELPKGPTNKILKRELRAMLYHGRDLHVG